MVILAEAPKVAAPAAPSRPPSPLALDKTVPVGTERGPIGPAEYARITVAVERGTAELVLSDMGIPGAALLRIQRVWLQRTLTDPKAAKEARAALAAARAADD